MNALKRIYTSKAIRSDLWFLVRLYLAYEWISAATEKLGTGSAVWIGTKAGTAIKGFLTFAASPTQTGGDHPSVLGWYAWLINHVFLPNATALSYMVAFGELFIGIALGIGLFTRFAAFWAAFLNLLFMLAGSTGINPPMFTLEMMILLVGGTAGLFGMDIVAIPLLKKAVNRIFGRKVPVVVPAEAPVFQPIDRERYIASEHQVETPEQPTTRQGASSPGVG
ncbi:MAG TPA: DoxX family membrane protein [Ktedonobacterales bacterium]|nr:DoxX family membrane protein [Ktedonobacterales bacterium]